MKKKKGKKSKKRKNSQKSINLYNYPEMKVNSVEKN